MLIRTSLPIAAFACRACSLLLTGALIGQATIFVDVAATSPGNGSVGSPFTAIASGIAAANNGDTVAVLPGTYFEHLQIVNKSVNLESTGGADATIIDGSASGTVLRIGGWVSPTISQVAGFTLTNGNGQLSNLLGDPGGLAIDFATVIVTDCKVINNVAGLGAAGGIQALGSNLTMVRCEVIGNDGGDTPSTKNGLQGRGGTGGVRFQGVTPTTSILFTMTDCLVRDNIGGDGSPWIFSAGVGGAGGIDANTSGIAAGPLILTNCRIVNNSGGDGQSSQFGGGLGGGGGLSISGAGVRLLHCTIARNIGGDVVGGGTVGAGGIQVRQLGAFAEIVNSIVWNNVDVLGTTSQIATLNGTSTANSSNVEGGFAGAGNIQTNPQFRDAPNGDYRLTGQSPCIDAGDGSVAGLPLLDFEGDPRLITGNVDMGVDEACQLGTADGFDLTSLVDGLGDAHRCWKAALPGNVVQLTIPPPAAAIVGKVGVGFFEFFTNGAPGPITPLGLASVHIDPFGPQTVYYSISPIGSAGETLTISIPVVLSGVTVRAQFFAISSAVSNGLFAATSAHDIMIQ